MEKYENLRDVLLEYFEEEYPVVRFLEQWSSSYKAPLRVFYYDKKDILELFLYSEDTCVYNIRILSEEEFVRGYRELAIHTKISYKWLI